MDINMEEGECDENFNHPIKSTLNVYDSSYNDDDGDDLYTIDEQSIIRCGLGYPDSITKERLSLEHTVLDIALTGLYTNKTLHCIKSVLIDNINIHNINTLKFRYCQNITNDGYSVLNDMPFITQLIIEDDYCISYLTLSILKNNKHLKSIHFLNCSTIHSNVIDMLYTMSNLTHLYFYYCNFVTYSKSMLDYYACNNHIKVKIKEAPKMPQYNFISKEDMEYIKISLSS
jgi:hypothetical protein